MTGLFGWVVQSGVVQGVIIGATLAFLTAILIMNVVIRGLTTEVNGWSVIPRAGRPGNGFLVRAACAKALPVVNVFEEAAYWKSTKDGAGRRLHGRHDYVLRFPKGGFPPNDAFWSLTVADLVGYATRNPVARSSVNDRSEFVTNPDGSVEIHLQHTAPSGQEQNWLPVPGRRFTLMLRAYLPAATVLDGTYRVPRIERVR
ncbi:DUF1214 domain-containing protein [Microbacterium sp. X-17]|uniref:DUF1214 domain-containing protein n=1 Tax=Microbacterium sp. X-17 TaxID=3144404 RepID=UPI0031F4A6CC